MHSKNFSHNFPSPTTRGLARCAALGVAVTLAASPAQASFHAWSLREIYSDNSGTLQYLEFFTTSSGQNLVGGRTVSVVSGTTHSFTIPSNLPSSATANKAFLIGTAGLQAAGGPAPDYIMQNNFLFTGGGTINFFGTPGSVAYTALPTDGVRSRQIGGGDVISSPQNFAGATGTMVPEPATWALFGLGGIGMSFLLRRRAV